jgi:segregation and condensation protein A
VAAIIEELELDLEVFTGPFDLLLTLVLREEVDLLEVELADVVVSYLDVLDARGELDLDVARSSWSSSRRCSSSSRG